MNYSDIVVYLIVGLTLAVIGRWLWQFWVASCADILRERLVGELPQPAAVSLAASGNPLHA
jgi:hypothetical protein